MKELNDKFGADSFRKEETADNILTLHTNQELAGDVLTFLKTGIANPYSMLYDLTAIDERNRKSSNAITMARGAITARYKTNAWMDSCCSVRS